MEIKPADPGRAPSPRLAVWLVAAMVGLVALPAAILLYGIRTATAPVPVSPQPSPHGYTISLLLFIIPVVVIAFWFLPSEGIHLSKRAFWWTFALLFPLGASLDFFFARYFFTFPNRGATLGLMAPALGGPVPVEEYLFYFTGFLAVLLLYIWFDEYWLAAYSVPGDASRRSEFDRLLHLHPESLLVAVALIVAGLIYQRLIARVPGGFPGYWTFLVLGALTPSSALFPAARPVINWRAFSLTMFMLLLTSLLWEATLALPYGWWNFQDREMLGIRILAWQRLPVEEVFVWIAVSYATVIVYEVVKRWQASGRTAVHAFTGRRRGAPRP